MSYILFPNINSSLTAASYLFLSSLQYLCSTFFHRDDTLSLSRALLNIILLLYPLLWPLLFIAIYLYFLRWFLFLLLRLLVLFPLLLFWDRLILWTPDWPRALTKPRLSWNHVFSLHTFKSYVYKYVLQLSLCCVCVCENNPFICELYNFVH